MVTVKGKRCARCGKEFRESMVRRCHHPAVKRVYGEDICYYCCKACKYVVIHDIGITCSLTREKQ